MGEKEKSPVAGGKGNNKMGLIGAISYIIGNIVGSGIFIAPTSILESCHTVGLSLVVWAAAALISILGSFCYVELGTSIRSSGADFAYLCYVKWYPIAFAFMVIGCVVNYPATIAIQAITFSEYIIKGCNIEIESETASFIAKKLIAFALIWLLMFLNFFSLKSSVSRFQMVATLAKVAATSIVIVTGFYFLIVKGETKNIADPFKGTEFDIGAIVTALFAGLFTYDGWDILNFGAEEIEKPKRTMPLAIIIGMSTVALIYLASNVSYFVVLSVGEIKDSEAVASTFAQATLGNFQYAIPFLICVLLVGSLNSSIFSASRYLYAAARHGHLPTFISCTADNDSPRSALFVHVLLAMIMSFAGDLNTLLNYIGLAAWSQRACTMVALLYIRFTHKPIHPNAIRTPIIMPIMFFLICSALVIVTIVESIQTAILPLAVIAGGFIAYFTFIYERSLPSFKWFQRYTFIVNDATTMFTQIVFNAMPQRRDENENVIEMTSVEKEEKPPNSVFTITPLDEKAPKKSRRRKPTVVDTANPSPPIYQSNGQ